MTTTGVRWAPVHVWRGGVVAWVGVGCYLAGLAVLALVSGREEDVAVVPIVGGGSSALVLALGWFAVCLRVDPSRTTWSSDPEMPDPAALDPDLSVPGWRSSWRAGWRPALVTAVGTLVVLTALAGVGGFAAAVLLVLFLLPVATLLGFVLWGLLVYPALHVVAGVRMARGGDGAGSGLALPMALMGMLVWCVLPLGVALALGVDEPGRRRGLGVLAPLFGIGPGQVVSEPLLWTARGFGLLLAGLLVAFLVSVRRARRAGP